MRIRSPFDARLLSALAVAFFLCAATLAQPAALYAQENAGCGDLPDHAELTAMLQDVVMEENGGFDLHMWATIVNRDSEVCAVTFSGNHRGDQWPGSRVISAQKANTANAFSLPGLALSTANLYTAVQPGNGLYGLQHSNPVDTSVAYGGDAADFGQPNDPMTGLRIGGVNVFGGGLALYRNDGTLLGALGVSGDTSCADHIIAWKVRDGLGLDSVPAGVSETGDDNIVYDASSGWAHPLCGLGELPIFTELPSSHPTSPIIQEISAFDPAAGELPEGIAVDADNNIYVGMALSGEILQLTPDGEVVSFAMLPSPGDGFLLGMEFDDAGNLYAALASFDPETQGLYRVGPDGGDAELVVALDSEGLPNDVTFDSQGNVYITDSIGGQVWRIDPDGELEVWVADDLLLGVIPPGPPLNIPIGANGLVFNADESYLYVASSEMGRIVRFPVNDDGSAGEGEVIVESELLGGADGLAFDAEGTLYVAAFFSDSIMTISPEGDLTVVAQGGLLQNPSTLKFGHGDQAGTLFVLNFGLMRVLELMPGAPEPRAMMIHLD